MPGRAILITLAFSALIARVHAQDTLTYVRTLKKLSLEQLMDVKVISVSRSPQKLTDAASAIQVITNEDIRRSGVTRLPEALRLASNLIVAQSNSHDWGISSRGFNGAPLSNSTSANKLLVMIDGRTVYTPLFGGVFWDVQNVLLEDVERIEVVSGPGGTLWGANAVNGVINIITKQAKESTGLYATIESGTFLRNHVALRYGAKLDDKLFLRVYAQRYEQDGTKKIEGGGGDDNWELVQSGFRMDYAASSKDEFTLQGDFYQGNERATRVDGQNILSRWSHKTSEESSYVLQVYYDRTWRYISNSSFAEDLQTFDLDFQDQLPIGKRQTLLWGAGYRMMNDNTTDAGSLSFNPEYRSMGLASAFVQDRISFAGDRVHLTIGSKLLHNVYTGWEVQPSARVAFTVNEKNLLWTAVSRTVRTPTRWDADEVLPTLYTPANSYSSEKVLSYELGYRASPIPEVSFSVATFYNEYYDVRSVNENPNAPPMLIFANDQRAQSAGVEISGNYYANSNWRLRGGYIFLNTHFWSTDDSVRPYSADLEGIDPKNQLIFQSILDLPGNLTFDIDGRYVHHLHQTQFTTEIPSYCTFNAKVGWQFHKFTIEVVGKNLLEKNHLEFGSHQIPRSVYGRVTCRL